jgi:hypothetical protein
VYSRQALLDARVAEAAEAWLSDPRDVGVYARLVAAVDDRRRYRLAVDAGTPDRAPLESGEAAGSAERQLHDGGPDRVPTGEGRAGEISVGDVPAGDVFAVSVRDGQVSTTDAPEAVPNEEAGPNEEAAQERSWPAVRSVGADLAGDPAEVLRRLRGG